MDESKQVVLTIEALRAALAIGGIQPSAISPLSVLSDQEAVGAASQEALGLLREVLWLSTDAPPQLLPEALLALGAVAAPEVIAGVLVGSSQGVATTSSYAASAWAPGALVSFDMDAAADRAIFVYPQSPQHLLDLVLQQVVPTLSSGGLEFTTKVGPDTFVALLSVLDWQMHSQLRARLEREPLTAIRLRVGDLWRMLVEGRAAVDLGWMVSAFAYLMPMLDFTLDDARLEEATQRIAEMGWLRPDEQGGYALVEALEELGNALLPVISFAALNVARRSADGAWRQTHLVVVQGMAALLLLQPVLEDDRQMITVDSVVPDELALLLGALMTETESVAGPAALFHCGSCQAELQPADRFCRQCGQPVRSREASAPHVSPRLCPRCGNPAAPGARFCPHCGASLAGPEEREE